MHLSPFPYIDLKEQPPRDGIIFKCPIFCKRNFSKTCKEFYNRIAEKEGIFACPYGFATQILYACEEVHILTCLNIEKYSDRKLMKKRIANQEFYPRIKLNDFHFILSNTLENRNQTYLGAYQLTRNYINDVFHELRTLNTEIKQQSDYLIREIEQGSSNDKIHSRAHNIFSTSQLISIRLNTFDFNLNPEMPFKGSRKLINVFKKFEKIIHCLEVRSKKERINVQINGNSYAKLKAYEMFELLPFLLLDNAIKYSLKNSDVKVEFIERSEKLIVEILNFGPPIKEYEKTKLFNREYRGEFARQFSPEGSGIGLYIAEIIAANHNITIDLLPNSQSFMENGIELAEFLVRLTFNDAILNE
jgi:signal transduction histidine kinase